MNQKSTSIFNFCIFIFILLLGRCSCDDYYYEACATDRCAYGPEISYPFYISGLQRPFCGYAGFELNCSIHGYPILHIHGYDYIVDHIFYENSSLHVHNAAFESLENGCLPQIENISLASTPFRFEDVSYLNLLSDCNSSLPKELEKYKVGCDGGNGYGSVLAMFDEDENFGYALEECGRNAETPVEVHEYDGNGEVEGYQELMRRGFALNWTASDCSKCQASGGRCGFNETTYRFSCYCADRPHSASCPPNPGKAFMRLILSLVASVSGVVILIIMVFYLRRKYSIFKTNNYQDVETFLKQYEPLAPKRYRYSDVKKMTSSFKINLGDGGYGSVYKGKLRDGSLVAVKILKETKGNGEEFINEMASISRTSHVNIVKLVGFCFERNKRALIYEFMSIGSLEKFIYKEKSLASYRLGWQTLSKIAVGIARGLEYLHCRCNTQILHFEIKPYNILLDEQLNPKISDFGLSKLCTRTKSIVSILGARGTVGYIAPEVVCRTFGGVSHKSDVYSYGMMILEMVGGRKNVNVEVNHMSEIYYPHWIYKQLELNQDLGFDGILNEEENEIARKMVIISLWCIQTDASTRPSMTRVVEMLEGNLDSLQIPPRLYLYSPPRSPAQS